MGETLHVGVGGAPAGSDALKDAVGDTLVVAVPETVPVKLLVGVGEAVLEALVVAVPETVPVQLLESVWEGVAVPETTSAKISNTRCMEPPRHQLIQDTVIFEPCHGLIYRLTDPQIRSDHSS